MAVENLRTVKALAGELAHVPLTESALRWYIFKAEENGLAGALVKRGGRVFVDKPAFERWMFTGSASSR
jgi:hypothetical protein